MIVGIHGRILALIPWRITLLFRKFQLLHPSIINIVLRNFLFSERLVDPNGPIVSLTTHGSRVDTVYLAIESIGRGRQLPSRIVLWLDDQKLYEDTPASLKRLKKRGIEIGLTNNYGPHTKYYPYIDMEKDFDRPLVTADDDILYPDNWLKDLLLAFFDNDQVINCFRARRILFLENKVCPFIKWKFANATLASHRNFLEGVSGVIYPPKYLYFLRAAGTKFLDTCPKQDDLWLNVIALRNGFRVRQINDFPVTFRVLPNTQDGALWSINVGDFGDSQIEATFLESDLDAIGNEDTGDIDVCGK